MWLKQFAAGLFALLAATLSAHAQTWTNAAGPISGFGNIGTFSNGPYTFRVVINAANVATYNGTQARVTFCAAPSNSITLGSAYVGQGTGGGSSSFAGSPAQLLFGGNPGVTISAGACATSDAVTYAQASGDIVVSLYRSDTGANIGGVTSGATGWACHHIFNSNDAANVPGASYGTLGMQACIVSRVEFLISSSPPPTPTATAPAGTFSAFVSFPIPAPTASSGAWTTPSPLPAADPIGSYYAADVPNQIEAQRRLTQPLDLVVGDSIGYVCPASAYTPWSSGFNYAISGNTTYGVINQLSQFATMGTPLGVHSVIPFMGINDWTQDINPTSQGGRGMTMAAAQADVIARHALFFQSYTGNLVWPGILPTPAASGWNSYLQAINAADSAALANRPRTHDVSAALWSALVDSSGGLAPAYQVTPGNIHPSAAACAAAATVLSPAALQPF